MTTLTKTYTDNYYDSTSYRKTWTVVFNFADITISSSTFQFVTPSITAKFVGTNGVYRYTSVNGSFKIGGTSVVGSEGGTVASYSVPENYYDTLIKGASNATFTITKRLPDYWNTMGHTQTLNTATFFTRDNATSKTLSVVMNTGYMLSTNTKADDTGSGAYYYPSSNVDLTIGTVTLNAPPTVTLGTPIYENPHYAGFGSYTVPITSASAQYGGDITKVVLTVGSNSTTQTYSSASISNKTISVTPIIAGTYTPTVVVTDSRGQTTTKSLPQITVNPYNSPSLDFDVFRSDSNGVKDDEGAYGLVTANVSFTDAVADITEPTVQINGTTTSNVTWYSAYNSSTGISSVISDWSTVSSGDTIYGLINGSFSQTDSYQITVQIEDSLGGESSAISQTLSTAFYTIDFQAGGKEIAFGKPANDTLTTHQEDVGLFKCGMESQFNESVTFNDIANFDKPINITGLDTEGSVIINELSSVIDLTESAPSEIIYDVPIRLFDSNGTRMGSMQMWRTSGDILGYGIQTSRYVNGAWVHNDLNVRVASDGTRGYGISDPAQFRDALNIRAYGMLQTLTTTTLSTTAKKLPLTSFTGVGCSLSSNGIKVAKAGVYVISGTVYANEGFTANDIVHAYLYVNSTSVCENQIRLNVANYYSTINVGPIIRTLSANDVVYLYAMNQGGARGNVGTRNGAGIALWQIG